jgi:enoyl-CoA hydratase/carnithine racemase
VELLREGPRDGVLVLRLNRPQRLNALTLSLTRELTAAVQSAMEDAQVRVLLLQGEGERGFCAGKDRDDPATAEFVEALQQLASALMCGDKPVVAAVQGWAVGAGLELLLNCDIVIAAPDAQFMLPETKIGLLGTGGVLALLPQKIGLAKAKGVLLLGEAFSAAEAERWGVIWKVAPDARGEAEAVARKLAAMEPAILAETKQLLHREAVGNLAAVLAREAQAHGRLGG